MDDQQEMRTPDQKYEAMFQRWYAADEVDFVDAAAEERYKQSLTRVRDAVQLRVPDRVPYIPLLQMYPYFRNGLNVDDAMYDYEKVREVWKKTHVEIDPDLYMNPILSYPGKAFEAFDYRLMRWPRHGIGPDQIYQFIEGEYMTADEYDEFLFDPTDYLLRKYYPRVYGACEPLANLPPFHNGIWLGMLGWIAGFATPGVGESFEKLVRAGQEMTKWFEHLATCDAEIKALGYPNVVGGITFAPFDLVGDTMRGTKEVMLDMYRRPDKLLAAIEKMTRIAIRLGIDSAKAANNPMTWMYLHKGAGGFMSDEQFNTFYWPSLRELIVALVDEGLTPCVYSEGDYTPRLEAIADVPKGRVIYHFETVDYAKAKEVLGDVACIMGNVPLTILATGTKQDVTDYCKMLIDVVGKDGGLILDSDLIDEAKDENVEAMGPFVREYGVYG
jgi:hypothetical protein